MGGSGGGGAQTKLGDWADPVAGWWKGVLERGNYLTGLGVGGGPVDPKSQYQRYPGERIAGLSGDQNAAMGGIRHFVGSGGSPATQAANGVIQKTLEGDYLGTNPWDQATVGTRENNFKGLNNPYFDSKLKQGMDDIVGAYQLGTSADTNRMFNMGGAFGGSAHQQAIANNEAGLGKTLSNFGTNMLNDQFNRSAQLEDSDLSRSQAAQSFNKQLGHGSYESGLNRMMGAIPLGQNEQDLFLRRANALMGIGDIDRSMNQDRLNLGYQDWQDERNFDMRQLQNFMGLLSTAQGGIGGNITQTSPSYQASPYSLMLGGLMGYNALKGP